MRKTILLIALALFSFTGTAYANTSGFDFLVRLRANTIQCPNINYNRDNIEDAMALEGRSYGWSILEVVRQIEDRYQYELAKHAADPDGYCSIAKQLEQSSINRLRRMGITP